ncbi:hypothetical protein NIES2101_31895 [Calothrix sp. HK-06]|nr:hypothetical protein NIES2101_31895 [Calothrix sp. HK-06]
MKKNDFYQDFFGINTKNILKELRLIDLQYQQQALRISQMAEQINVKKLSQVLAPSKSTVDLIMQGSIPAKANLQRFDELVAQNSGLAEINRKALADITASIARSFKLADITQTSLMRQLRIADNIGTIPNFSDLEKSVYNKFLGLSTAYSNLTAAREEIIVHKPESARVVSELPALEVLNSVEVLESVSAAESDAEVSQKELELEQTKESLKIEILGQQEEFEQLLITAGWQDLVRMWQGANAVLNSTNNPDYVRHFGTSLRELLTQVIQRLSPDKEIKKWTEDKNHFHNGSPTRKARLLYISRSINHNNFSDFLEEDVDSTLELISSFNRATHAPTPPFSHTQLLTMQARLRAIVNFLIEIWRLNE